MWIDIAFLICLLMAVLRGLRQGFVIAVLSGLALVIGLAAAIKLSATVAMHMRDSIRVSDRWLPVLAFILVFVCVVLLVRWIARLAEAALDLAMMGWLNKLAGILLFAVLYTIAFSVLLFYGVHTHVVSDRATSSSVSYPFIRPLGPVVIDEFGKLIPLFKGMFAQLEDFFGRLSEGRIGA